MSNVSRFERLIPSTNLVEVDFDGQLLLLADGGNLAAELLNADITSFRKTPVSGSDRGPFCMMGSCFECLVEINGTTQQACMMQVSGGMKIKRAYGKYNEHS